MRNGAVVNYPAAGHDLHVKTIPNLLRGCIYRDREPPLLEESDSLDKTGDVTSGSCSVKTIEKKTHRNGNLILLGKPKL